MRDVEKDTPKAATIEAQLSAAQQALYKCEAIFESIAQQANRGEVEHIVSLADIGLDLARVASVAADSVHSPKVAA